MRINILVSDLDTGVSQLIHLPQEAEGFYDEAIDQLKKNVGQEPGVVVRAIAERIKSVVQSHLLAEKLPSMSGEKTGNDATPAPAQLVMTDDQFGRFMDRVEELGKSGIEMLFAEFRNSGASQPA